MFYIIVLYLQLLSLFIFRVVTTCWPIYVTIDAFLRCICAPILFLFTLGTYDHSCHRGKGHICSLCRDKVLPGLHKDLLHKHAPFSLVDTMGIL